MRKQALLLVVLLTTSIVNAQQNIGIGTTTPNASALLDVTSTTKGVLAPRLTTAQMNAIASPAAGLLVFNTDSAAFAYRNATAWVFLKGNTTGSNDWSTTGNAGTNSTTHFIGTTDNQDLVFKRNNARAGWISNFGNTSWGLGALNGPVTGTDNTATGFQSLYTNTTGLRNVATGFKALYNNISGFYNVAIGAEALYNNTGGYNIGIGGSALYSNSSGDNNVAIGYQAMYVNNTGFSNIAIGSGALLSNTNFSNLLAIGDSALYNNGIGVSQSYQAKENTAIGSKALYSNTTGFGNTANGYQTLYSNTAGFFNTAFGSQSLYSNTTGTDNTGYGYQTLYSNTIGSANTAHGQISLNLNTTGSGNTAIGASALSGNTTGNNNTATGALALLINSTGNNNTANGDNALRLNTTGNSNVAIGVKALYNNSDRSNLVAIGDSALFNNGLLASESYHSINNTALGSKSLYVNNTGYQNTALGFEAMKNNESGAQNVAVGVSTMLNKTSGFGNIGVGNLALSNNISGSYNIGIGALAGSNSTGSSNIFIGYHAGMNETGSNKLYIANKAFGNDSALLYGEFDNNYLKADARMEIFSNNSIHDGLRVIKNYAPGTNQDRAAIYGQNTVDDFRGIGVDGAGGWVGVRGTVTKNGNNTYVGVNGVSNGAGSLFGVNKGVEGNGSNSFTINYGVHGIATGNAQAVNNYGVRGDVTGGGTVNLGVFGTATGANSNNYGVRGEATGNTGIKYGVYGSASGTGTNYAGYFNGATRVEGLLGIGMQSAAFPLEIKGINAGNDQLIKFYNNLSVPKWHIDMRIPDNYALEFVETGVADRILVLKPGGTAGFGKMPDVTFNSNASRLQVKCTDGGLGLGFGMESASNADRWDLGVDPNIATPALHFLFNGADRGFIHSITGAYVQTSDRRYKKDIITHQPVLNNLLQLESFQFHYLDNKDTDPLSTGFMAQDVQKIFPGAVFESGLNGEKALGVNYQYFTVAAIKAIQEQQKIIASQEERILKLEKAISLLLEKKQ